MPVWPARTCARRCRPAVHARRAGPVRPIPLVTLGNHTRNHAILVNYDRAGAGAQIRSAQQDLLSWTGRAPVAIAYPNGNFDDTAVAEARGRRPGGGGPVRPGPNLLARLEPMTLHPISSWGSLGVGARQPRSHVPPTRAGPEVPADHTAPMADSPSTRSVVSARGSKANEPASATGRLRARRRRNTSGSAQRCSYGGKGWLPKRTDSRAEAATSDLNLCKRHGKPRYLGAGGVMVLPERGKPE